MSKTNSLSLNRAAETKVRPIRLSPRDRLAANLLRAEIVHTCSEFETALNRESKDYLRALHARAKLEQPGFNPVLVSALFEKHKKRFKQGAQIDPTKISPSLHLAVHGNEWNELFLIVRALWSMPYSKGYGRRIRFVVYDDFHDAVIGIIGLQSPPADLSCRDELFDYPLGKKLNMVNMTMDAFSVGAVPPYSYLLGGKLCAGLISSDPVRQAYWRQYAGQKTQMLQKSIQQPLAAVTTASAFGRSSMYNRLQYKDRVLAEPIGYTMGFGTLHLEHLYGPMCDYLKKVNAFTEGGFGNGPKVRWQNITNALIQLKLPPALLRHGVKREVFMYRLVDDLEAGMAGKKFGKPFSLLVNDFSAFWRERWAVPRAERYPSWNRGDDIDLIHKVLNQFVPSQPL